MMTRMTTFGRAAVMLMRDAAAKGLQLIRRAHHAAMESRRHRVQAEQELFLPRPLSPRLQERRRSSNRPLTIRPSPEGEVSWVKPNLPPVKPNFPLRFPR